MQRVLNERDAPPLTRAYGRSGPVVLFPVPRRPTRKTVRFELPPKPFPSGASDCVACDLLTFPFRADDRTRICGGHILSPLVCTSCHPVPYGPVLTPFHSNRHP